MNLRENGIAKPESFHRCIKSFCIPLIRRLLVWEGMPYLFIFRELKRTRTLALGASHGLRGRSRCTRTDFREAVDSLVCSGARMGFVNRFQRKCDSRGEAHTRRNWTSKLGVMEDIEHFTVTGLEGGDYGKVVAFSKGRLQRVFAG